MIRFRKTLMENNLPLKVETPWLDGTDTGARLLDAARLQAPYSLSRRTANLGVPTMGGDHE
jgi:hypothetical protein